MRRLDQRQPADVHQRQALLLDRPDQGEARISAHRAAFIRYRDAVGRGYIAALNNLAIMYDNGEDVSQDDVTAHMWFNLAAASGFSEAARNRDTLARQMTSAQIAEAQKLAREWKPK